MAWWEDRECGQACNATYSEGVNNLSTYSERASCSHRFLTDFTDILNQNVIFCRIQSRIVCSTIDGYHNSLRMPKNQASASYFPIVWMSMQCVIVEILSCSSINHFLRQAHNEVNAKVSSAAIMITRSHGKNYWLEVPSCVKIFREWQVKASKYIIIVLGCASTWALAPSQSFG